MAKKEKKSRFIADSFDEEFEVIEQTEEEEDDAEEESE